MKKSFVSLLVIVMVTALVVSVGFAAKKEIVVTEGMKNMKKARDNTEVEMGVLYFDESTGIGSYTYWFHFTAKETGTYAFMAESFLSVVQLAVYDAKTDVKIDEVKAHKERQILRLDLEAGKNTI